MFIATGSTLATKLTGEMVDELNTQVAGFGDASLTLFGELGIN